MEMAQSPNERARKRGMWRGWGTKALSIKKDMCKDRRVVIKPRHAFFGSRHLQLFPVLSRHEVRVGFRCSDARILSLRVERRDTLGQKCGGQVCSRTREDIPTWRPAGASPAHRRQLGGQGLGRVFADHCEGLEALDAQGGCIYA